MQNRKTRGYLGRTLATTGASLLALAVTPPVAGDDTRPVAFQFIQLAQAERAGTRSFNIPAGDLQPALLAFSRQVDLQLLYPGELTADLRTAGVQGQYTPDAALDRLLAGTGLQYRFSNASTVTLARADVDAGAGPIRLDPVRVEGWSSSASRGYRPDIITSATKTDSLIADTPVSVSVVTADVITDQNATSVAEALRNVPGVEPGPNLANVSVQEEFTVRGFENSFVNVNGMERRSTGPVSVANIESIEVLKGPSSVLTGQVAPGGFINIQTKRPQREAAYELTGNLSHTTVGDGTKGRGVIDATGPANADETVLYRFIASADAGDSFIDKVETEQYLVNPMLSFIGQDGTLRVDVDVSYLRNDETFRFGIPFRSGAPDRRIGRTTFLATPDNEKVTEDYNAEVRTQYTITPDTQIDLAFAYHLNEHLTRAQRSFPDDEVQPDDTFGSSLDNLDQESEDLELQANVIHNIRAGQLDWRLMFGGDLRRSEFKDNDLFFASEEPPINVLNPSNDDRLPQADDPDLFRLPSGKNTTDSYGFYGQAEVWINERVKLLGGFRYEDVEFDAGRFGNSSQQNDDDISPRGAILVKVTQDTSIYGSYSESFQQQSGTSASGDPFEPKEGEQWEVGIKQELFDGGVLATLSGFRITQSNLPVTDPEAQVGNIQIGEVESNGIELEFKGQVSERLRLTAGYSFIDNEIGNDPLGNEGNRLANVPEHQASAFALYDVQRSETRRLSLGGGIFYTGERFTNENNAVKLDDYTVVDITAQYGFRLRDMEVQLRGGVKNLFDEEYFEQGAFRVAFRGEPRTVFANLTARF